MRVANTRSCTIAYCCGVRDILSRRSMRSAMSVTSSRKLVAAACSLTVCVGGVAIAIATVRHLDSSVPVLSAPGLFSLQGRCGRLSLLTMHEACHSLTVTLDCSGWFHLIRYPESVLSFLRRSLVTLVFLAGASLLAV